MVMINIEKLNQLLDNYVKEIKYLESIYINDENQQDKFKHEKEASRQKIIKFIEEYGDEVYDDTKMKYM